MIGVSEAYRQAIRADRRQVVCKVEATYVDPNLDSSITVTANEEANVSWRRQACNDQAAVPYKWFSLDGSSVLDGSYRLAPHNQAAADLYEMGWWGSQVAGAGGAFASPYPTLSVTFTARNITRLFVAGDSARGEYPVDFQVRLYNAANTLLHTESVTGNASVQWAKELSPPVLAAVKLELVVTRWSHAGRQVKIAEAFPAVKETYTGSRILELAMVEEREVDTGTLPVGNIAAAEVVVALSNHDHRFDPDHIESPLWGWVRQGVMLRPYLGVVLPDTSIEWVPLGVFWSVDWKVEDSAEAAIARVVARNRLDRMRRTDYRTPTVMQNTNLYAVAEAILQDAGLEPAEYAIDSALQSMAVSYAWFGPMSHLEALRQVAEAALAQVYVDRQGKVRVAVSPTYSPSLAVVYPQGGPFPAEVQVYEQAYGISAREYFRKASPSGRIANDVTVSLQPWTPAASPQELYRSQSPLTVPANSSITVLAEYSQAPAISVTATLEGAPPGVSVSAASYYSWYAEVTITNATGSDAQATLVLTGTVLESRSGQRVRAADEASIRLHGRMPYELTGNTLIQSESLAQSIASNLLAAYAQPRRDVQVEWRGDPALELGDLITVPDSPDGTRRGHFVVVRQELRWAGALRAVVDGRRIA